MKIKRRHRPDWVQIGICFQWNRRFFAIGYIWGIIEFDFSKKELRDEK